MKKILYLMFAAGVALPASAAQAQRIQSARATRTLGVVAIPAEDAADSLFRLGRQLVTDREYRRAAGVFKQLVDKYPQHDRAGEALYWRAWSLYQLGRDSRSRADLDEAMNSVTRFNENYGKDSRMAESATELTANIRGAQARLGDANAAASIATAAKGLRQSQSCSGSRVDDEMRSAAMDGLLTMSSEDALPILRDVLKQRDPCRLALRKKAVFIMSQKGGNDIVPTLLDVARNDPAEEVRSDAVFWLSQTRSERAVPALDSILFQARDEEMRKKAIFALSQQNDDRARAALRRAAEDERMPQDLRGEAIWWLGQQNLADLDWFKSVFRKTNSEELRKKIMFSVSQGSQAAATTWLLDVAKDKAFDSEVRKEAIFSASQRRNVDLDAFQAIYDQAKGDEEIQKQVIFVYSQRRESAAVDKLMAIAKSDANVEMRKQAVFWLGQKNDPRIKQFLRDLISK